jgi:hypothetical protein
MRKISEQLDVLIPKPCFERPFVCDGLPESCNVIVIGENPTTQLERDWWSFWSESTGFDLPKFEAIYAAARTARGKRPISNTRARLNRLRAHKLNCLETNAYSNERPDGHGSGVSNAGLLRAFLSMPRLKAVIAHGTVAQKILRTQSLPARIQCYCTRHFRSESYATLDSIAREILALDESL